MLLDLNSLCSRGKENGLPWAAVFVKPLSVARSMGPHAHSSAVLPCPRPSPKEELASTLLSTWDDLQRSPVLFWL